MKSAKYETLSSDTTVLFVTSYETNFTCDKKYTDFVIETIYHVKDENGRKNLVKTGRKKLQQEIGPLDDEACN